MPKVKTISLCLCKLQLKIYKMQLHQFKYDTKFAQVEAARLLVSSRIGVNYT